MGMWGYVGRQTGRLILGLAGAFLLAAAVAALSQPGAGAGLYLSALFSQIDQVAHLRFGNSAITSAPVMSEILRGFPVTFELMGAGLVVALLVGIPIGLLFATGRFFRPAAPLIQAVTSVPLFCVALLALWLANYFGAWDFSHSAFTVSRHSDLLSLLRAIAIPALIAGATAAGAIQLALHRAVLGAMREPFYENMRRMGLGGFEIDRAYLAPYLLMGFFRGFGEIALSLFAADAVVEWVFDWPGAIGLFLHAVALRDWSVAGPILLVVASVVIAADVVGRIGARAIGGAAP
jgi:peptide/nickel transport system permease protein